MEVSIRGAARAWGCSRYSAEKRLEAGETPPGVGEEGAHQPPQFENLPDANLADPRSIAAAARGHSSSENSFTKDCGPPE